jgi:Protein of unknown function (DUF2585)
VTRIRDSAPAIAAGAAIILVAAIILHWLGHPWICTCGYVKLWHGVTVSSENSQQLTDWYTPSHIIHGILFYFGLWLVAWRWPLSTRALIALLVEATWEVVENTPWIINRYREATISLDYFGDSVINSVMDILAMLVGFWLAARLPVWLSIAIVVALELIVGALVRDNLTLNVIMLLYPLDAIRDWQAGG